ncbi:metallophosphoesterase family protein [Alteribacter natronophilus]|uniref:metallophosphoesterase family protein n=1 Tax=Alteribacter natronophilus TaxID=2583810 RepID=UPI00110ECF52|nr:metallophosphoesterase family protein [Alteribacter natronophilus]TMW73409.1 metallophosphoesterase family protein [Alteribacter natronophilus]
MRILVMGDTHMPKKGETLPHILTEQMKRTDHIIHTGDWQEKWLYDEVCSYAPVTSVYGNADGDEMKAFLKRTETFSLGGVKIGIVHGDGEKKTTEKRALDTFDETYDCIVFGHSHIPYLRYHGKKLLFNPGSPTDKRKLPYFSFGFLTVIKNSLQAEHCFFNLEGHSF